MGMEMRERLGWHCLLRAGDLEQIWATGQEAPLTKIKLVTSSPNLHLPLRPVPASWGMFPSPSGVSTSHLPSPSLYLPPPSQPELLHHHPG